MSLIIPVSSATYDPSSLGLGKVVPPEKMEYFRKVWLAEEPLRQAQKKLDSMVQSHGQLQRVNDQMEGMDVKSDEFKSETEAFKNKMSQSALAFAKATIAAQEKLDEIEEQQGPPTFNSSSRRIAVNPLDTEKSELKQTPIASESFTMDVQYFRNEFNSQGVSTLPATVSRHISEKYAVWSSPDIANKMSKNAYHLMASQSKNHPILGTIAVVANCTHKKADFYDPVVLNNKNAVQVWNKLFPDDKLKTSKEAIEEQVKAASSKNALHILSGTTKSSSFVGLVHLMKSDDETNVNSSQQADKVAKEIEMEGKDSKTTGASANAFAEKAINLLSKSTLESHCSMVVEGMIPEVKSTTINTNVQQLKPDTEEVMKQLETIMKSEQQDKQKLSAQFTQLNNEHIKSVVAALGEKYESSQNVFDANNLMTCFTDFVTKAQEGTIGNPFNLYVTEFTKNNIAESYRDEFYPPEEGGDE